MASEAEPRRRQLLRHDEAASHIPGPGCFSLLVGCAVHTGSCIVHDASMRMHCTMIWAAFSEPWLSLLSLVFLLLLPGLDVDRCKGVECSPGPCQLAALCEQETGLCRYLNASDDQWCQPTPPEATGFCQAGTCSGEFIPWGPAKTSFSDNSGAIISAVQELVLLSVGQLQLPGADLAAENNCNPKTP